MRTPHLAALLIAAIAAVLPGLSAANDNPSPLTVADYLEYEQVADPQLSPDGKTVVYTRRWIDTRKDAWESSLWIAAADGSRSRFLVEGSNARWSPSGDRILFIGPDEHQKSQLFTRWMDAEGAVTQITRGDVRPNSPTWSPDGRHIAFVAVVPAPDESTIPLPKPPEGATWTKTPRVLDRLHYRQDQVGFVDPGFSHLFVVPAEAGSARQLTTGAWHVGAQFDGLFSGAGLDWTPDGRSILFDGWNEPDGDLVYRRSHIYSIDIDTSRIERLTTGIGLWSEPKISRDGKSIVYLGYPASPKTYEMPRLHVMRRDGSGARQISADFDRPASNIIWDANDRGVFFTAEDAGYINIFYMSLDGRVRRITSGQHTLTLTSTDTGTKFGVGIRADFRAPGDIHRIALDRQDGVTRLTQVNEDLFGRKRLGTQEELWFTAADGNRAHGWIVKPPDFDPTRRYPLIMEIHGGPFSMYRGQFDFMYQLFAASGYVVLYTNPRGSTGYGEAFSQAIDRAYPSVDHLDLMAAVDAVVAQGYIDTDRLYVGGCSGGGVLSSWMIGHTDRFAAAAVRCPVSNWLSMAGTTDIPGFTHSFFDQPFWVDPGKWLHHSPLMHVGKVTTPTIVMTGEQDLRTPMAQSEEYYAALKLRGVPAKLIRFNDQYHGTGTRPSNWMRTVLYITEWYDQWSEKGPRDKEIAVPANR